MTLKVSTATGTVQAVGVVPSNNWAFLM